MHLSYRLIQGIFNSIFGITTRSSFYLYFNESMLSKRIPQSGFLSRSNKNSHKTISGEFGKCAMIFVWFIRIMYYKELFPHKFDLFKHTATRKSQNTKIIFFITCLIKQEQIYDTHDHCNQ